MLTIHVPSGRFGGRQKGSQNKVNADIRAMILEALDDVGGPRYLSKQAKENPVAFMGLLGKILPTKIEGDAGSSITLHLLAAQLVSEQLLAAQQAPPTLNAEPVATVDLLNAPVPTE